MPSLTHTRCFNHGQREAVARCPACKRHYCRECITEHEYRLLCASCIASLDTETAHATQRLPFRGIIQFSAALFVLWVSFYVMGQALLLIPSSYHDSEDTFLEQGWAQETDESKADDGTAEFTALGEQDR